MRTEILLRYAKKIVIGAAGTTYPGWFSTNQNILDITDRDCFARYWKPNSRVAFLSEHVWEHLDEIEREAANANVFKYLKPGGWFRIAVPDGFHRDREYIEYVRPGGSGPGSDDHKVLFNYRLLKEELEKVGFQVKLLEYWDEKNRFHFSEWDPEMGYVHRSSRYDRRNANGHLKYTSLIVDAEK